MEFDAYRLPGCKASNKYGEFSWYAALVWVGRKPSPRYCATKEDLAIGDRQFFGGAGNILDNLAKANGNNGNKECMQVGEVRN